MEVNVGLYRKFLSAYVAVGASWIGALFLLTYPLVGTSAPCVFSALVGLVVAVFVSFVDADLSEVDPESRDYWIAKRTAVASDMLRNWNPVAFVCWLYRKG